jgi:hypothetical protein
MPYREKIAWLSLIAIAVTFIPYFTLMASGTLPLRPMPDFNRLGYYALTTFVQVILLGIGHLALRLTAPEDARMPPDERDNAIARQSISAAYYVLIVGAILVGCVMPFLSVGWAIVNAMIFMIVLAEVVHYGVAVVSYRRQAS